MTFHTALRQLKPSLITAHLLQHRRILIMWFNKYFCIQRTYLMSLTAQGNSCLPDEIKKKTHLTSMQNIHALTRTLPQKNKEWNETDTSHVSTQTAQQPLFLLFQKETRTNDSNERNLTKCGDVFTLSDNILTVLSSWKSNSSSALIITCPK